MQEKPAAKLTSGRITEALIADRQGPAGDFDRTLRTHLDSFCDSVRESVRPAATATVATPAADSTGSGIMSASSASPSPSKSMELAKSF